MTRKLTIRKEGRNWTLTIPGDTTRSVHICPTFADARMLAWNFLVCNRYYEKDPRFRRSAWIAFRIFCARHSTNDPYC